MELREYWRIVRRYAWLIVLVTGATLALSLATRLGRPPQQAYAASMRFTVGIAPEQGPGDYYTYDRYYTWLASEYLVDDLSEVVRSAAFAAAVSEELAAEGIAVAPGAISGSTVPVKQHRILSLTVHGDDPQRLQAIADAAAKVLGERNREFLAQLGSDNAAVFIIDPPIVYPLGQPLRERLDLPLRLLLALAASVALAFTLSYLDDSVRDERDLRAMGLTMLAALPKPRRR